MTQTEILDLAQTQLKQNPSPDRYNIRSTIGTGPKATLGTRTKDLSNKNAAEMPSPSTYDIKSTIGRVTGITLGGRLTPAKVDDIPGPGQYSPSRLKSYNYPSLGSRIDVKVRSRSPDFYEVPSLIGAGKKITLGSRNAFNDFSAINRDTENVGPGSHSPNFRYLGEQPRGITLKSRQNDIKKDEVPGPGAYYKMSEPKQVRDPHSCTFGRRIDRAFMVEKQPYNK